MKSRLYRLANIIVYRCVYYLSKFISRVFFRMTVKGRENIPLQGGCILAANHASFLDPPIVGISHSREMYSFAKAQLFGSFFGNIYFKLLNCIPVNRDNPDVGMLKKAIRIPQEGKALLLFPEGTRSEDGVLKKGKLGIGFIAHKSRVPIIPVFIEGSYKILPKGCKWPKFEKIRVNIGKSLYFNELYGQKGNERIYQEISDQVMESIQSLRDELLRK